MLSSTVEFTNSAYLTFTSLEQGIMTVYSTAYANLQFKCD